MCGIAGIWNGGEPQRAAADRVSAMLRRMPHRGPDGQGGFAFDGGAAGMVRLALVDLSDRGQQPLWSPDRKVAILFNGEIYNFREHRARLAEKGYRFQSKTDSEVILALYLEDGEDFVRHLRGMYAIALFDWRHFRPGDLPELLLARDPLGIKPLYIAPTGMEGQGCIFASEIRSLIASRLIDPRIDQQSLRDYLHYGFTLQPRTILSGVRMLEPGVLERYVPGKPVSTRRFWSMPAYEPRSESLEEAAERLRQILEESVAQHAFADAKVGAFLSGGVDSTGIVGLMRNHIPHLKTYTLRFPEYHGCDEAAEAKASAKRFDCENTTVDVTGTEVRDSLPTFAGDLDQPSTDGLNTWLISRAAGREVKGVLSGLGGDEWFAGYPCSRRMLHHGTGWRGRAIMQMGKLANSAQSFFPVRGFENSLRERVENYGTRRSLAATWVQAHTSFTPRQVQQLTGDLLAQDPVQPFLDLLHRDLVSETDETPIGLSGQLDVAGYMRCQLLRDSDATSMAHSLELRVPFVDIELASFARTCKDDFKLDPNLRGSGGFGSKLVLQHALGDVLPHDIRDRPKRGFALPIQNWMSTTLRDLVLDTNSPESVKHRGFLRSEGVAALTSASASLPALFYPKIWSLVILELWCRSVLDTNATASSELERCHRSIVLMQSEPFSDGEAVVDSVSCGQATTPR
jgi:asparagine synthase (glutamine-hydrolysing)